jgi:hypothetical protein
MSGVCRAIFTAGTADRVRTRNGILTGICLQWLYAGDEGAEHGLELTRCATITRKNADHARRVCGLAPEEAAMFGKLFHWLKIPVTEVPEEIAVCEFECGKAECHLGDWERCERRLKACGTQPQEQERPPY